MKRLMKIILPQFEHEHPGKRKSAFEGLSVKEVFTTIYERGYWKLYDSDSVSGRYASLESTQQIREKLPRILDEYSIQSIVDIGCGDFGWMKEIVAPNVKYTGYDIVNKLIESNRKKYGSEHVSFQVADVISDTILDADLILLRDVLVHLKLDDIKKLIRNIQSNNPKLLAITHFPRCEQNLDITTGNWRRLNLCKAPFSFSGPDFDLTDGNEKKRLAFWKR